MTFLTIYTPTYKRPRMLALCQSSVLAQSAPVEHVVIRDEVGLGIAGMYADIPNHAGEVHGEYVMVLSDDNILTNCDFAAHLEAVASEHDNPDVILFKGQIEGSIQPLVWNAEPQIERIDLSCFAVRREIWTRHAGDWGKCYAGDFYFIHKLWECGYRFYWWDRMIFKAMQISRGESE